MEQSQKQIRRREPKPVASEWLEKLDKEIEKLHNEYTELQQYNDELIHSLKRMTGDWLRQREAIKFALEYWFDRVYPPDIFIGGPSSDPGVNEVREVANKLRAALEREHNGSLPETDG